MSGTTAIATTSLPHGLIAQVDQVIITGATGNDANLYNGTFQITATTSTTFHYAMSGTPSGPAQGAPGYFTIDRRRLLQSLTSAQEGGGYVATAQMWPASPSYRHGLILGDAVRVTKASLAEYNGYFKVVAVPDDKTFKYNLPSNPGGPSASGYFGRLWQAARLVIENNNVELVPSVAVGWAARAIALGYPAVVEPPLFRQVSVCGNAIRRIPGSQDSPGLDQAHAILISGVGELLVERNVVDLDAANPIQYWVCGVVNFMENRTSAGVLVRGFAPTTGKHTEEISTRISDLMTLAI